MTSASSTSANSAQPSPLVRESAIPAPGPVAAAVYVPRYEQRLRLAADALVQNSQLDEKAARDLAVHVLYAIDHIPEKLR